MNTSYEGLPAGRSRRSRICNRRLSSSQIPGDIVTGKKGDSSTFLAPWDRCGGQEEEAGGSGTFSQQSTGHLGNDRVIPEGGIKFVPGQISLAIDGDHRRPSHRAVIFAEIG